MKLTAIGVSRKEMYPQPSVASDEDSDKKIVYPEVRLEGAQSAKFGADGLKVGKRIRQMVEWEVKEHVVRKDGDKKPETTMVLCLLAVGPAEAGEDDEQEGAEEDSDDRDVDPGIAYLEKMAAKE